MKMVELLGRQGVVVPERTLNRYLAAEFGSPERSTVPVVDGEPGVELQVDFGELGKMFDEETGKLRRVWALVFTAGVSRHTFVWLSFNQNLGTVIDGCEAAWDFFGGVFKVLVPDNMATVVTKADALDPVLNVAFVEYAQSRGFLIDPARVRAPQGKGRVERAVQFVQTSFWAGEDFGCLVEARDRSRAVVCLSSRAPHPWVDPGAAGGGVRRGRSTGAAASTDGALRRAALQAGEGPPGPSHPGDQIVVLGPGRSDRHDRRRAR
ncbi:MAG: transposase [Candidatus Microthrix sp.]|nr:transposase [Candidatus Microthrix sp.]